MSLVSGNILNNSGQIRSGSAGAHTEGVYLGGTDNYVLNSGDIAGGQYGILTEVEGYQNQIVNTGTISGSSIAIALTGIQGISERPTSLTNLALDPSRYGIINHGDIVGGVDRNLRFWAPEGGEFRSDRRRRIRGYNHHQRI